MLMKTLRVRITDSGITELRCVHCKQWFPATTEYFYRKNGKPLNLSPGCRVCQRLYVKVTPSAIQRKLEQRARAAEAVCRKIERDEQRRIDWNIRIITSAFNRAIQLSERRELRAVIRSTDQEQRLLERQIKREVAKRHRRIAHRAIEKRYRQSEKGKRKQQVATQKKRARKRTLPNTLTLVEWRDCLEYFGHRCAVCGQPEGMFWSLAQDHWIPLSYSGDDNPGTVATNIVPLCHSVVAGIMGCNNLKSNQMPQDWLVDTYGKRKAAQIEVRIRAYFQHVETVLHLLESGLPEARRVATEVAS